MENQEHKDSIVVTVFTKQLDLMWKQAQYISTVEAGTLVWWYLLKETPGLGTLVLLFSSILMGIIFLIMRRYAILVNRYSKMLRHIVFPTQKDIELEPNVYREDQAFTAHLLLRFIPVFLIVTNMALLITMWLEYWNIVIFGVSYLSALPIASVLFLILYFSLKWETPKNLLLKPQ